MSNLKSSGFHLETVTSYGFPPHRYFGRSSLSLPAAPTPFITKAGNTAPGALHGKKKTKTEGGRDGLAPPRAQAAVKKTNIHRNASPTREAGRQT